MSQGLAQITGLVARFEQNTDLYKAQPYNETQVRREFIDPFFEALGWDVANKSGYAEAYKDVIHEDAIKVGGATKAPDYCFRIGGVRKFFLEAKKPSVDIRHDVHPAFQLRRYAWSAKLPLSILTDFEEMAVYDCRVKPAQTDAASTARVMYIKYTEYPQRWEEIAAIFSREAVLKGSFDKYAESAKRKKGTAQVDDAFLSEIESWRDELAHNIALRNFGLSNRDLNFAVQMTIDRIIFLRICEDRGVESYGELMALLNGADTYQRLLALFRKADDRYNSGLFHFTKEKDRPEDPDELTPGLTIDDKVLKDVFRRLYYPDSPYEFSVLPAEILGQVYEQFLGKVITLTAGHRARVEEKPEVKKAGGVYYTPTYIVDYIVKNTVGRLIWGYAAEADGTCLGCRGEGLGAGGEGRGTRGDDGAGGEGCGDGYEEKGETGVNDESENTELPGPGSLAGRDGISEDDIPVSKVAAQKRTIRDGSADVPCGSIYTCQHCGRSWIEPPQGVSESSLDSAGVPDGTGNLCFVDRKAAISKIRTKSDDEKPDSESRKASQRIDPISQVKIQSLIPSHKPLTPKQAERLRILDPACGSGSFLLGAYQYLLDWHWKWYLAHDPASWAKKKNPPICQTTQAGGLKNNHSYKLTLDCRKRILLNNIFGVDIDTQAVEVTKLSLLLRVLEGEKQLVLFHRERALPDLARNIKCGNSLIGPDFYENQQRELFDDEEIYRINAFDWKKEFAEVFGTREEEGVGGEGIGTGKSNKGGKIKDRSADSASQANKNNPGFDAVIGNPPYIRIQGFPSEQVSYFTKCYQSAVKNADIYVSFVEKGYSLLSSIGILGYILPNKFFRTDYGEGLRKLISINRAISHVIDFKESQVFKASTYTCLLFLSKQYITELTYAESEANTIGLQNLKIRNINIDDIGKDIWDFVTKKVKCLINKIEEKSVRLLDIPVYMSRGSSTGADNIFIFEEGTFDLESKVLRTPLFATDFGRYNYHISGKKRIVFPYFLSKGKFRTYSENELRDYFPKAFEYLTQHKKDLKKRKQYKSWYSYSAPRNLELHDQAHIIVPLLANHGSFSLIPKTEHGVVCPMASAGFTITIQDANLIKPEYLIALLNSSLLFWRLEQASNIFRGGWITCTKQYFGELPIRLINKSNHTEKDHHDQMVSLVDRMLELHKRLHDAKTPDEKKVLERQVEATDGQIDRLVYELYGLTEEEIRIVDESTKNQTE